MFTSDFVYLDGSNKNDRGRQLEKETMSEAEANKHFRLGGFLEIYFFVHSRGGSHESLLLRVGLLQP